MVSDENFVLYSSVVLALQDPGGASWTDSSKTRSTSSRPRNTSWPNNHSKSGQHFS